MPDFNEWFSAKHKLTSGPDEPMVTLDDALAAADAADVQTRTAAIVTAAVALIEHIDIRGVAYDHDQVVQNLRAATRPPAK